MKLALYNSHDSKIGLISGLIGGIGKYFIQIHTPFIVNLVGAMFTALMCGFAGVLGKEIYTYIKRKFKNNNKPKNKFL